MKRPLSYCFLDEIRALFLPVVALVSVVSTLRMADVSVAYVRFKATDPS